MNLLGESVAGAARATRLMHLRRARGVFWLVAVAALVVLIVAAP